MPALMKVEIGFSAALAAMCLSTAKISNTAEPPLHKGPIILILVHGYSRVSNESVV